MTELELKIALQRRMLDRMRPYTDHWYFVSGRLAEMVRDWRKTNTLAAVEV